jgi:DNA gyrase subunit B
MVRDARTVRQPIQQIARKVGSQPLVEQAAIAGVLNPTALSDAQLAGEAASYLARRLDALTVDGERGWEGRANEDGVTITRMLRGVRESHTLSPDILRGVEARRLDQAAVELQARYAKPGKLIYKDKMVATVNGPISLFEAVIEQGRKGLTIQRYKGLGEMNADQLWDTTLDPDVRSLLQVRVSHADEAEEIFSTLMGDVVEPRKDFIQQNALSVANLDV